MSGQRKWTPRRRKAFLAHLRLSANVTAAAEAVKVSRSGAYALRAADPGFRAAWDDAIEGALDDLEAELRRRAVEGVDKPVYYQGREIGTVKNYSDNLAMFLLRARRPHIYGNAAVPTAEPMEQRHEAAKAARRKLEEALSAMAEAGETPPDRSDV